MSKVSDLHKKWGRDPDYQAAYEALQPEFELARSLIEARMGAGLTPERQGHGQSLSNPPSH